MANWLNLSDDDRDRDMRNELQIAVLRSMQEKRDPTFHLREYIRYRMGIRSGSREEGRTKVSAFVFYPQQDQNKLYIQGNCFNHIFWDDPEKD